jgi:glycosyltransferase involved in cell wall biosynthesis
MGGDVSAHSVPENPSWLKLLIAGLDPNETTAGVRASIRAANRAWLVRAEVIEPVMEMTIHDLERQSMGDRAQADDGPLVSVVITTYNRANYVAETIESVARQTYTNVEIIVIDDGSTDDTSAIVERLAPDVRYIWQENSERGAARNHGLRLAKGEFIAFLDSDDLWLPTKLEREVEFLDANPRIGLVYMGAIQIDSEGRELGVLRAAGPSGRLTRSLLQNNCVSIGAHLARTSLIRDIGGFREERQLSGAEDWEMWVRLSLVTDFAYLPTIGVKIRTHPANTMSDATAMCRSTRRAAELIRQSEPLASAYKKDLRRMDANLALVNAINYCSSNQRAKSIKFLKAAVSANPGVILDRRFSYTIARLLKSSFGF